MGIGPGLGGLEIAPHGAPHILGVLAQDIGGVEGGHNGDAPLHLQPQPLAAGPGDARGDPQKLPQRRGPQGDDDAGADQLDLALQQAQAGGGTFVNFASLKSASWRASSIRAFSTR